MSLISIALAPRTLDDAQRLAHALQQLAAKDAALRVRRGEIPGQVVVSHVTELDLEILCDRLRRDYQVEAGVGRPQVVYRVALLTPVDGEFKYATQSSDRGEYAHVKMHLFPGEPGSGVIFESRVTGAAMPLEFIEAAEQGVRDRLARGVMANSPVDVRVTLYDGSYHEIDSTGPSFRTAASLAVEDALRNAETVLLEPVMRVEVDVPADCRAAVIEGLIARQGHVEASEAPSDGRIRATVRLVELFGYSTDFRTRTLGRGSFIMTFEGYRPVAPDENQDPDAFVRVRLRPTPTGRDASVALPEPDAPA